jgi:hypothetical protein
VARNGQQVIEKAASWDWNTGEDPDDDQPSNASHKSPLLRLEEDGDLVIKGDVQSDYLNAAEGDGVGEREEGDYNFSENYLGNSHEDSLVTPYISITSPLGDNKSITSPPPPPAVIFPAIDSCKSKSSSLSQLRESVAPPSSLSVSFAQMISSHSRPNIPIGNIPSVVEKALKRKKTSQTKKEEKK